MEDWLKMSGVCNAELKRSIEELIMECSCKVAREPFPQPIVSTNIPETQNQTADSLDIVYLEGVPFMHADHKYTG